MASFRMHSGCSVMPACLAQARAHVHSPRIAVVTACARSLTKGDVDWLCGERAKQPRAFLSIERIEPARLFCRAKLRTLLLQVLWPTTLRACSP